MEPLVSTAWLAERLDDPDLRVLESTVFLHRLAEPPGFELESGRAAWAAGHIPTSAFADLIRDLSDPDSTLRFTMPRPERFTAAMEALGVGEGTRVIVYDRNLTMWATRVWWMLRAFGFDEAAVLDGGWTAWTDEGREVSTEAPPERPPARFEPRPRPSLVASRDDVVAALEDGDTCIVNALSAEQHRGEDGAYPRRGHIPGALNVPARELLDAQTGRFLERDELRRRLGGILARPRVVTYCGGGIAATSDAFALALLGHPEVAVYDASLSEWAADPELPLVVGD